MADAVAFELSIDAHFAVFTEEKVFVVVMALDEICARLKRSIFDKKITFKPHRTHHTTLDPHHLHSDNLVWYRTAPLSVCNLHSSTRTAHRYTSPRSHAERVRRARFREKREEDTRESSYLIREHDLCATRDNLRFLLILDVSLSSRFFSHKFVSLDRNGRDFGVSRQRTN